MVTHDNYLAGFADKIIRIKDGKIIDMQDNRNTNTDKKIYFRLTYNRIGNTLPIVKGELVRKEDL